MKIIGVCMVRNEDIFIRAAILSVVPLCDRIILIDTGSTDNTRKIAHMTLIDAGIDHEVIVETNLLRTHRYVEPYIGTDTWVFGFDGDEIHEPAQMAILRARLLAGEHRNVFQIKGMYLHVDAIDIEQRWYSLTKPDVTQTAEGWLGPPSHNPTKLYNFRNLVAWPSDGKHTLFHPKTREIADGVIKQYPVMDWKTAELRCYHFRFWQRSSREADKTQGARLTPEDLVGFGSRADRGGGDEMNERVQYRQGPIHSLPIPRDVAALIAEGVINGSQAD